MVAVMVNWRRGTTAPSSTTARSRTAPTSTYTGTRANGVGGTKPSSRPNMPTLVTTHEPNGHSSSPDARSVRARLADEVGHRHLLAALGPQLLEVGERARRVDGELAVDVAFARRAPGRDRELSSGGVHGHMRRKSGWLRQVVARSVWVLDDD